MEKILDLSYLNEISGGDTDFVKEMLELFLNTTTKEISQFDQLVAESNWVAVGNLAHKLKAPIQMLGATELFGLVRNLEFLGKENIDTDKIADTIVKIKKLVTILANEITEKLKTM